ncbi:response regulator [Spirosoma areae]
MSLKGPIISVEDDLDDQYLIRQAIQVLSIPNELRFFSNGQEAFDYLSVTSEKPFIILCDINMPVMNGLEFRRHIQENESLRRKSIPFIYFTTAASPELIAIAYKATVQGFYQKATQYDAFQQQIRLIVDYWRHCLHPNYQG